MLVSLFSLNPFISIEYISPLSLGLNTIFENTIFTVDQIGRSKFTIPYLDGSLSISRASRTFPQFLVFKPGMVITAILLCFYWYKTNLLINHFKKTDNKINSFMVCGILSAIFLIIHSLLLGIETDIKIFKFLRRVVLLSFIIFEIVAQTYLVLILYSIKDKLTNLINFKILKLKLILVSILIAIAVFTLPFLNSNSHKLIKHALEWNYFIGVIGFYFLTFLMWKNNKKN